MSVDDFFGKSTTIKAEDLNGKAHKVIIETVTFKGFDNGEKIVLELENQEKGFVLNKTNLKAITQMYSDSAESGNFKQYVHELNALWMGKEITIYPTTVDFNGQEVACIRVKVDLDIEDSEVPF